MLLKRFLIVNLLIILLITLSTRGLVYSNDEKDDDIENNEEKTISIDTRQGDLILNIDDITIIRGPHKINVEAGKNIDLQISNSKHKLLFKDNLSKDDIPDNIILVPPEKDLVIDKSTWFIIFGISAGAFAVLTWLIVLGGLGEN